jgi:hypothetical protein
VEGVHSERKAWNLIISLLPNNRKIEHINEKFKALRGGINQAQILKCFSIESINWKFELNVLFRRRRLLASGRGTMG